MVSATGVSVNGRGSVTNIEPIVDSVIKQPPDRMFPGGGASNYVFYMANQADEIPPWGSSPGARDIALRQLWHTEPILAGAVSTTVSRYAAFNWRLDGPDRMTKLYDEMLQSCQQGKGWLQMITPVILDLITQDNGAFIEIVRTADSATAPVVTLNHLDAARCIRTGRLDKPVIYWDLYGQYHLLSWYQVIPLTLMPSPVEYMRGMQYSIITCVLRAAQIMRDISVYHKEKVSGQFNKAVHLISGVQTKTINDALLMHRNDASNQGLTRYLQPVIIASLDPTAKVSKETIELASLPDGFDLDAMFRQYITQLALGFGTDYQEFAPLSGGGLGGGGSAGNSETLHLKARGKGPRMFMSSIEYAFNYHGVLPSNVKFSYAEQDAGADLDDVKLKILRAEERAMRIKAGELTPEIAVKIAVDSGDLDKKYEAELLQKLQENADAEKKMQQEMHDSQVAVNGAKLETARDGGMKSPRAPQMNQGAGK